LIDISQLHLFSGDLLYLPGQFADLCAILLIEITGTKQAGHSNRVTICR
jgi:hypothetical protein